MGGRPGALLVQFCDGSLWYSLSYSQLFSSGEMTGWKRRRRKGGGPSACITRGSGLIFHSTVKQQGVRESGTTGLGPGAVPTGVLFFPLPNRKP